MSASAKGMTSLYADLLDATAADATTTTINSPAVFTDRQNHLSAPTSDNYRNSDTSLKKQVSSTALRFQPLTRRPQPVQHKQSKKAGTTSGTVAFPIKHIKSSEPSEVVDDPTTNGSVLARVPITKSTIDDWATNEDDDVNGFYGGNARQRGGRKRRKKNKEKDFEPFSQDWDDIYDPSRPNSYEEYKGSEEKEREMKDWRDKLYGRRRAFSSENEEHEEHDYDWNSGKLSFAPPMNYSFAPPPANLLIVPSGSRASLSTLAVSTGESRDEVQDGVRQMLKHYTPTPDPQLSLPVGGSGINKPLVTSIQKEKDTQHVSTLNNKETADNPRADEASAMLSNSTQTAEIQQEIGPTTTTVWHESASSVVISQPPIIYERDASDTKAKVDGPEEGGLIDGQETLSDLSRHEQAARSRHPGQKGFAERLMSKYGWTKGSGLGARESGITQALHVQAGKGKDSKGTGKIIDKNKRIAEENEGRFGKMSEVIVLHKMVDGLENEDVGILMQEIGDECSEKYGRIERVYIQYRQSEAGFSKVFVQFTSPLSALNAVNALEGRIFNGNVIEARFFDPDKFEKRELD